jgi:hypothetical protein
MPRKVDRISGVRLVTDEKSLDWALDIRKQRREEGKCPSCGCVCEGCECDKKPCGCCDK